MTPQWFLIVGLISIVVMTLSATAVQLLHEFERHKLETYCRRRGKIAWFHQIMDLREELALGAQTLQMISMAATACCLLVGYQQFWNEGPILLLEWLGIVGAVALLYLLTNCWIPWGALKMGAVSFLYRTWRLWWITAMVLQPLSSGVEIFSTLFRRASGKEDEEEDEEEAFEEEIRSMVSEGQHDGFIEADAREMIEGVIDLDDNDVASAMNPRSKVDAIDVNMGWQETLDFIVNCGRTRIPVFRHQFSKQEDVVGILFAKDLLAEAAKEPGDRKSLAELVRDPIVVPASTMLDEMLKKFLAQRTHMAIVLDEYNSVAGVITIEDILEEIVGEIMDEADPEEPRLALRISPYEIEVAGAMHVEDVNEEFGLSLPANDEFDTISGLIMNRLSQIPKAGHTVNFGDIRVDILDATRRTIDRVKITSPKNGRS